MKTPHPDHPIRKTLKHLALASIMAAANALMPGSADAAPISWNAIQDATGNASDVVTTGTFFDSAAANNAANVTLNGVTFRRHLNNNTFDASGITWANRASGSTDAGGDDPPASWDANYRDLAKYGIYQSGGGGGITINLSGLSIGQEYLVQIWTGYWDGANWQTEFIAGNSSGLLNLGSDGSNRLSQYVVGTFIADATTQVIQATGPSYAIPSFMQVRAVATPLTTIVTVPENGSDYLVGSTIPAIASVLSGTAPYTVDFLLDSGMGFVSQGTDSEAPYTKDVTFPAIGSYSIKATVTDDVSATAESAVKTFTVSNAGPTNLAAVSGNQLVNLSWNQVLGATGYTILRSTPDNSNFQLLQAGITDLTYQDSSLANGTPYFYIVRATVGATVSADSNEVSATPLAVDDSNSTVVVSEPYVFADGSTTSTITVTLKDSGNAPAPDLTVTLASSRPSDDTVSAASGLSDASGVVTFTVSSSVVGTSEYTATVTDIPLTLTDTATVGFVDPAIPFAVNVNFTTAPDTGLEGPTGGTGLTWNQITTSTNPSGALLASTGVPTGASASFDVPWVAGWDNPSLTVLRAGIFNFTTGADFSVTISGLDAGATYDLWILTRSNGSDSGSANFGTFRTGNTNASGDQVIDSRGVHNGDTWVQGQNYAKFNSVVANESGVISFTSDGHDANEIDLADGGVYRLMVNGLQIVKSTTSTTSFTAWSNANNAAGQTAQQDHDNDGVQNGVEYFMGEAGSTFTAMPSLNASNEITWPAIATYEGTYEVQTSTDLSVWTNVVPKPATSGGFLTYTLPPGAPGGKSFVRLLVTPTP